MVESPVKDILDKELGMKPAYITNQIYNLHKE
jgi:hypothetical protein